MYKLTWHMFFFKKTAIPNTEKKMLTCFCLS